MTSWNHFSCRLFGITISTSGIFVWQFNSVKSGSSKYFFKSTERRMSYDDISEEYGACGTIFVENWPKKLTNNDWIMRSIAVVHILPINLLSLEKWLHTNDGWLINNILCSGSSGKKFTSIIHENGEQYLGLYYWIWHFFFGFGSFTAMFHHQ